MISHALHEVPVGIIATGMRRECDASGSVDVPADRYWGSRTQRALMASLRPADRMPERFFRCYGFIKKAMAMANGQAGRLSMWKTAAIARAADDLIAGRFADEFPLPVWQDGSGRDADTNVNEVLANRANQLLGRAAGSGEPVDASRDVNMGQSLGSTFTASMFISTVIEIEENLVPRGSALARTFQQKQGDFPRHGQRLQAALGRLDDAEGTLHELGADPDDAATAPRMGAQDWQVVVAFIAVSTARPFIVAPDGFSDCGSVDAMVAAMAAVRGLAIVLLDITASVDARGATQAEATAMLCRSVIGQDQVVAAVASQGTAAACKARPLIISSVLNSLHHLSECVEAMRRMTARMR